MEPCHSKWFTSSNNKAIICSMHWPPHPSAGCQRYVFVVFKDQVQKRNFSFPEVTGERCVELLRSQFLIVKHISMTNGTRKKVPLKHTVSGAPPDSFPVGLRCSKSQYQCESTVSASNFPRGGGPHSYSPQQRLPPSLPPQPLPPPRAPVLRPTESSAPHVLYPPYVFLSFLPSCIDRSELLWDFTWVRHIIDI